MDRQPGVWCYAGVHTRSQVYLVQEAKSLSLIRIRADRVGKLVCDSTGGCGHRMQPCSVRLTVPTPSSFAPWL